MATQIDRDIEIPVGEGDVIHGDLSTPPEAVGTVVFAHGSGSSRFSSRNQDVAAQLNGRGLATLLIDLLTEAEDETDRYTREFRFDIERLAGRLEHATGWLRRHQRLGASPIGLFGASTGAAAALVAASRAPAEVRAVVSRGGRPDLAGDALPEVTAPTLLIVGGDDTVVIGMNEDAARQLRAPHEITIIPGATHLFEEPGALDEVARLAGDWFTAHLEGPDA
jgi:putative phosphoribosyl transferase